MSFTGIVFQHDGEIRTFRCPTRRRSPTRGFAGAVVILGGMLEVTGGVHAASLIIGAAAAGIAAVNCGGTTPPGEALSIHATSFRSLLVQMRVDKEAEY